jgi:modification target Cys-rich repeat protein
MIMQLWTWQECSQSRPRTGVPAAGTDGSGRRREPFNSVRRAGRFGSSLAMALALSSCSNGASSASSLECDGDFGTSLEARRLELFLRSSADLFDAARATEIDLLRTCRAMGTELGMTDAEIFAGGSSRDGTAGVETACTNVDAQIHTDLVTVTAGATVLVELQSTPPRCDVFVSAYADCVADCDVAVDPGSVELTCEGGELRGQCDAECTGTCAVEVDAACSGTCEGYCEGNCSARASDGSCAGSCVGTCHGQCIVESAASCTGECRGSCSVAFREPRCTGDVRAPMASASCQADCDARVAADVMCTPGETHLVITGLASADAMARAEHLRAAFEVGAASMFELRARTALIVDSGAAFVAAAPHAADDASSLTNAAIGCAVAAAVDAADAAASLRVSVSVTVMVSGTISGAAD